MIKISEAEVERHGRSIETPAPKILQAIAIIHRAGEEVYENCIGEFVMK